MRRTIEDVRARFGAVSVIEWTAYSAAAGDLTQAAPGEIAGDGDVERLDEAPPSIAPI